MFCRTAGCILPAPIIARTTRKLVYTSTICKSVRTCMPRCKVQDKPTLQLWNIHTLPCLTWQSKIPGRMVPVPILAWWCHAQGNIKSISKSWTICQALHLNLKTLIIIHQTTVFAIKKVVSSYTIFAPGEPKSMSLCNKIHLPPFLQKKRNWFKEKGRVQFSSVYSSRQFLD